MPDEIRNAFNILHNIVENVFCAITPTDFKQILGKIFGN